MIALIINSFVSSLWQRRLEREIVLYGGAPTPADSAPDEGEEYCEDDEEREPVVPITGFFHKLQKCYIPRRPSSFKITYIGQISQSLSVHSTYWSMYRANTNLLFYWMSLFMKLRNNQQPTWLEYPHRIFLSYCFSITATLILASCFFLPSVSVTRNSSSIIHRFTGCWIFSASYKF